MRESFLSNSGGPTFFPNRYPATLPIIADDAREIISTGKFTPSKPGFETHIIPEIKTSESPGRKKPISKPVSAKTTKSNNAKPP